MTALVTPPFLNRVSKIEENKAQSAVEHTAIICLHNIFDNY